MHMLFIYSVHVHVATMESSLHNLLIDTVESIIDTPLNSQFVFLESILYYATWHCILDLSFVRRFSSFLAYHITGTPPKQLTFMTSGFAQAFHVFLLAVYHNLAQHCPHLNALCPSQIMWAGLVHGRKFGDAPFLSLRSDHSQR